VLLFTAHHVMIEAVSGFDIGKNTLINNYVLTEEDLFQIGTILLIDVGHSKLYFRIFVHFL